MTTPATPSAPKPAGDDRKLVEVDETYPSLAFEDRLRLFWEKNRKAVIAVIVLVLVGLLAKGGWEYMQAEKERGIEQEYAASNTPEKLKAFAAAHAGHSLAGVARLQLADAAYAEGRSADAIAGYEEAIAALPPGPLASRAKLGSAMSKIFAGKPEGEAALKQLASDLAEPKAIRAEASYHLASLANSAGRSEDVRKYASQVMQIDPTSQWTQRALMLQASLPVDAAPAAPGDPAPTPAASATIKLPGK
jgi:hypothetical protein